MNRIRDQFSMRDAIASQLIGHNLPWLTPMPGEQALEKALRCLAVTPTLQEDIDNFSVLIDGSPEIVLYAANLDEDFIDEECISISLVSAPQSPRVTRAKLVAPQTNRFVTYGNTAFSHQVFDISVAQVEPIIQPNDVLNDFGWESMALVRTIWRAHFVIVAWWALICQHLQNTSVYSDSMPKLSSLVLMVFCTSLLWMQLGGMHMHLNSDGYGGLHGTHVHDAVHDGHGHEAETDVSLLELVSGWMKLLPFLIPFVFVLLAVIQAGKLVWASPTHIIFARGQTRWRPPLRAPPIPIS